MIKRQRRYPIDEIARRGTELYESKIRAIAQPGNDGRMLAIDIETGDYAVARPCNGAFKTASNALNPNSWLSTFGVFS